MKNILVRSSSVVLFLLVSIQAQAIDFTYEQLPRADVGVGQVSSAWDPFFNEPGAQVWDDFSLGSNTTITQVDWWGFNEFPSTDTPNFSVTFYSDASGTPGSALYSTTGVVSVADYLHSSAPVVAGVYEYSLVLTDPFVAPANTYWLSVFNDATTPFWGWQIAADGVVDGAIQTYYGEYGWTSNVNDAAFRIVGTTDEIPPVPEPASLVLLGTGLVAGAARARRKTRRP